MERLSEDGHGGTHLENTTSAFKSTQNLASECWPQTGLQHFGLPAPTLPRTSVASVGAKDRRR